MYMYVKIYTYRVGRLQGRKTKEHLMSADGTDGAVGRTSRARQLTARTELKTRSRSAKALDHSSSWTAPKAS